MNQNKEKLHFEKARANSRPTRSTETGLDHGAYSYDEGRGYLVPVVITLTLIITTAVGAYFYSAFQHQSIIAQTQQLPAIAPVKGPEPVRIEQPKPAQPPPVLATPYTSPYLSVYQQLDADTLPSNFDRSEPKAVRYLDQLKREPCDSAAIVPLMQIMEKAGYPREAAMSGLSFSARCRLYNDVLEKSFWNFDRVNDFGKAFEIASMAVEADQASGRYRFLRGTAQEGLKNYKAALSDYISTLQLFSDLSNVALGEFYRISRMYAALNKPCDAITPLEMFISFDASKRQTAQLARMITDYANSGNCRAGYASGGDRVILGRNNTVDVTINGARGRMIVDTGASMIAITPSFAARARIVPDEQNMITAEVVGGTVQQAPGYAQLVQVGNASATSVPLSVSTGNDTAFGQQVDGLLGMTFLARFTVSLSGGVLDLKPRALN